MKFTPKDIENVITYYWFKHYQSKDKNGFEHCGLCGNSGIINTKGTKTAIGLECGGIFYCICPNGQAMRKNNENSTSFV